MKEGIHHPGTYIAAWLARHPQAPEMPYMLAAIAASPERQSFVDACERLEAWQLLRQWNKVTPASTDAAISKQGNSFWWDATRLGHTVILYRSVTPQEAQTQLAYEIFISQFVEWLERNTGVVRIDESDAGITLFVPEGITPPDFDTAWQTFVGESFSAASLQQTFMLLVNSVVLAERGFSVPEVPIVTLSEADVLIAFVFAAMEVIDRRMKSLESQRQKIEYELRRETLTAKERDKFEHEHAGIEERLKKQHANYDSSLERMRQALNAFGEQGEAAQERLKRINAIKGDFTRTAAQQLKQTRAIVGKFVDYVVALLAMQQDDCITIPPLLTSVMPAAEQHEFSDKAQNMCYACGRPLPPKRKRKATYTANKLIFQAPSQTLQNHFTQTQPTVCAVCAALALVCPVKMADNGLVISLKDSLQPEHVGYLHEHRLRMLTTGELNIAAGRYAMLPSRERAANGKPLQKQMGGQQYALLKVASIFPPDVLERFVVEAHFAGNWGVVTVKLKPRHLIALRALIDAFNLRLYQLQQDKALNNAVADVVRSVEHDQFNHAIYTLMGAVKGNFGEVTLIQLEEGRAAFAGGLTVDKTASSIARRYRDIAGLTGLLYAVINLANNRLRRETETPRERADREREIKKLIEKTDHPYHFTYAVGEFVEGQTARLYRSQQSGFMYEAAMELLHSIDAGLQHENPNDGKPFLAITLDDVQRAYTYLCEQRYQTEKDLRDFTYELQLSLYTRFPEVRKSDRNENGQ